MLERHNSHSFHNRTRDMGLLRSVFPHLKSEERLSSVLPTKSLALLAFAWSFFYLLLWPAGHEWFAAVPFILMATKGVDVTVIDGLFLSALWMSYTLFITSPLYFFMGRYLVLMIYLPILGTVFYKQPHEPATQLFLLIETVFWDYPLMWWMRIISMINGRALKPFYSTITDAVAMGSMPLDVDVKYLQEERNIGLVVNMCREYAGPLKEYSKHDITQLHLPTPDVCEPDYYHILQGVHTIIEFIEAHREKSAATEAAMTEIVTTQPGAPSNETAVPEVTKAPHVTRRVFIHCKAGRGRAATMTLCYLLATTQLTPEQALKHILQRRHVVEPSVQNFRVVQKFVQRLTYYDFNFETLYLHDYVLNEQR